MSVPYMPPRLQAAAATTGLWALAAASIVFWGLRLAAPSDAAAPPAVASAPAATVDPAAVAQMFGAVQSQAAVAVTPDAASRFSVLGVVADADGKGAALMAVDGKPARPFRVGSRVADGLVLQSVTTRAATIGASVDSAPAFTLQLPSRPFAVMTPPPVMAPAEAR